MAFDLYAFWKIIHFIGLSWGVGAATISIILLVLSGKKEEYKAPVKKVIPIIQMITFFGLILLIISGIGMTINFGVDYWVGNTILIVKHVLIGIMLAVGITLMGYLGPKMDKLAPIPGEGPPSQEFLKLRKIAMLLGIILVIGWYTTLVLSAVM